VALIVTAALAWVAIRLRRRQERGRAAEHSKETAPGAFALEEPAAKRTVVTWLLIPESICWAAAWLLAMNAVLSWPRYYGFTKQLMITVMVAASAWLAFRLRKRQLVGRVVEPSEEGAAKL
jgi:hypothetical protein